MTIRIGMIAYAAALSVALFVPAIAQVPPKPGLALAPFMPVASSVDLMTVPGSAVFGTQWRTIEAKIVPATPIPTIPFVYKRASEAMERKMLRSLRHDALHDL